MHTRLLEPDQISYTQSMIIIIQKICSAHISTLLGAQGANPETPGQAPFSFTISVLHYFMCITQHTGPTALRPIRRTKQLWLSVLLKDTSAATGQAGIWTHILTTPELWQQQSPMLKTVRPRWLREASQNCANVHIPMWKRRLKHSTAEFPLI